MMHSNCYLEPHSGCQWQSYWRILIKLNAPDHCAQLLIYFLIIDKQTEILDCIPRVMVIFHVAERKQTHKQTDGWTDATKRIISLASRSITNHCVAEVLLSIVRPVLWFQIVCVCVCVCVGWNRSVTEISHLFKCMHPLGQVHRLATQPSNIPVCKDTGSARHCQLQVRSFWHLDTLFASWLPLL